MRNNSWPPSAESSGHHGCAGLLASFPASLTLMSYFLFLDVRVVPDCLWFGDVVSVFMQPRENTLDFPDRGIRWPSSSWQGSVPVSTSSSSVSWFSKSSATSAGRGCLCPLCPRPDACTTRSVFQLVTLVRAHVAFFFLSPNVFFFCLGFNFQVQVPDVGHIVLRGHDGHLLHHQSGEDHHSEVCPSCARAVTSNRLLVSGPAAGE